VIICSVDNSVNQIPDLPALRHAIEWLQAVIEGKGEFSQVRHNLDIGTSQRIEIDGSRIYAFLGSSQTSLVSDARLEVHQKYLDVQYMYEGEMLVGLDDLASVDIESSETGYISERDVTFYKMSKTVQTITLPEGWLAVLFPEDAHSPRLSIGEPQTIKTIVIKVLIRE
jgi:YhcH/YjgK/YiaL family protein